MIKIKLIECIIVLSVLCFVSSIAFSDPRNIAAPDLSHEVQIKACREATLEWLKQDCERGCSSMKSYNNRPPNHLNNVNALLYVRDTLKEAQLPKPFLYTVDLYVDIPAAQKFVIGWISDSLDYVPAMDVIDLHGNVVGHLDAIRNPVPPIGQAERWIRVTGVIPVCEGEDPKSESIGGDMTWRRVQLSVKDLREIAGIRFLYNDGTHPQFVSASLVSMKAHLERVKKEKEALVTQPYGYEDNGTFLADLAAIEKKTKELATPLIHAIESYHKEYGRFPQSLDELVPKYLTAISPLPSVIKPWKYSVLKNKNGTHYNLYVTFRDGSGYTKLCYDSSSPDGYKWWFTSPDPEKVEQ